MRRIPYVTHLALLALLLTEPATAGPMDALVEQANRGSVQAQLKLGHAFWNGAGTNRNYQAAYSWYKKAADQGSATAQVNLGIFHQTGLGMEQDLGQAFSWFEKASKQGDPRGQYYLGTMYEEGFGVARDLGKASSLYTLSAARNFSLARERLINLNTRPVARPAANTITLQPTTAPPPLADAPQPIAKIVAPTTTAEIAEAAAAKPESLGKPADGQPQMPAAPAKATTITEEPIPSEPVSAPVSVSEPDPAQGVQPPVPLTSQESTPEQKFQALLNLGLGNLQNEKFSQAQQNFQDALAIQPENMDAKKLLCLSAFQAQDYPTAIRSGESYLKNTPDQDLQFIVARAYELTPNQDQAISLYQTIASTEGHPHQQSAVNLLAALAVNSTEPQPSGSAFLPRPKGVSGFAAVSFESDDNVATAQPPNTTTSSELRDEKFINTLALNYDFPFLSRFFVGVGGLGVYNFNDTETKDFEFALYRGDVHLGMVGRRWSWKVAYEHDYLEFDHVRNTVSDRGATTFLWLIPNRYVFFFMGSVSLDQFPAIPLQDATKWSALFNNMVYTNFIRQGSYLSLKYNHVTNSTDVPTTYSYNSNTYGAGYYFPFPWWTTYIKADVNYERRPYDLPDPTFRRDETWSHSATLGKTFIIGKSWLQDINLEIYYRRNDTDSTVTAYNRIQDIWGTSFSLSF